MEALLLVEVYEDGPGIEFYPDTEDGLTRAKADFLDVTNNDCTASEVALFRVTKNQSSITSDTNMDNGQYEITGGEARLFYFRNPEENY